jgi:hypothetical protein
MTEEEQTAKNAAQRPRASIDYGEQFDAHVKAWRASQTNRANKRAEYSGVAPIQEED